MRQFVGCGLLVIFLLLISSLTPWQGLYASLQGGTTNDTFSYPTLYGAWRYFNKYLIQTEDANESSTSNNSEQHQAVNRSLILQEQSNDDDDGNRLDPGDISRNEDMLTPDLVAEELRNLNSTQIADYPLQELSSDDILATFNLLSNTDIQKVLANTKPENLLIIFSKLPGLSQESILNLLDASTKSYVANSIGRSVISP